MARSATPPTLRTINRTSILELLRTLGPLSQAEIARKLNMSPPTVARIADQLIEEGWLVRQGTEIPTGGRPASLLAFNGHGHVVVGIDMGGTEMHGSIANLDGVTLQEIYRPLKTCESNGNLEGLFEFIDELLDLTDPSRYRIQGIGVGVPGITLMPEGHVVYAPSIGWRDLELRKLLSGRYDLPCFVENDVNLAALGEYGFGASRGTRHSVCIFIGTGIGAGLILNGQLYRGANQAAGEIGFLLPGLDHLEQRYADFGALESMTSRTAIAARAARALQDDRGLRWPNPVTVEFVFNQAREGKEWAKKITNDTVDYLSLAIADVSAVLNPEVVVLGGGVIRSAGELPELIRQRIEGLVPYPPKVVASSLHRRAAVMGAIMLVLQGTTEHLVINRVI